MNKGTDETTECKFKEEKDWLKDIVPLGIGKVRLQFIGWDLQLKKGMKHG